MGHLHDDKIGCACDALLEAVNATDDQLIKASQSSRWEKREDINPYFSHIKQQKRTKKYAKDIGKVFSAWKKRFSEAYNNSGSQIFFFFRSPATEPLTEENWTQVMAGVIGAHELTAVLYETMTAELVTTFEEVTDNMFELHDLGIAKTDIFPPTDAIEQLRQYNMKFSQRTAERVDASIKNIIEYGLEDGLSNQNIAKQIKQKFDRLSTYEALRIARTETTRASNYGAMEAYTRVGVEKYDILPAAGACPICTDRAANNPYPIDDLYGRPPFHPHCRCTTTPRLK